MSRRGDSQQRRWSAWGWGLSVLLAALSLSACIEDVVIPPCLFNNSCVEAGAGGDGEGASSFAGTGTGGDLVVPGGGTDAGEAGADAATAGQGGEAAEPDTCPSCTISPEHLTPACAGKPYQASFFVGGGVDPHSWYLDPQPAGWSIGRSSSDPNVAVLHADAAPLEDIELRLIVTDARGFHRTFTLPLQVRTTCWFAYTFLSEAGPKLQLLDPLAKTPSPTPLDHAVGTYDFQFSPDGAFLAYRYGADEEHPKGRYLSLLDLTNLKEHPLLFDEDSVVSYAWAPTSTVLAVAYKKDGQTRLGGVRAPAPGSEASPPPLLSTSATIESDLYWVADEFVVFHAPAPVGQRRTPYYSRLGSAGFASPQGINRSFPPGVAVQPTDTGFYLISPEDTYYNDLTEGLWFGVAHLKISLVAPSGRYTTALTASGLPQLFLAETGRDTFIEPADDTQTCSQLLAWAASRERIACVADVSNTDGTRHGEIRIFDVNEQSERLDVNTLEGFCPGNVNDTATDSCLYKREGYSFSSAQAAGSARAISPSGRYLAFSRMGSRFLYIYFADLDARPMHIAQPRVIDLEGFNSSPLAFEFSPDERTLSVRLGPRLALFEPATGKLLWQATKLADATPCSEDFSAGPEAYCGNNRPASAPVWSADSRATAFRTFDGLTIIDLSPVLDMDYKVLPAPACAGRCSGEFAFQP